MSSEGTALNRVEDALEATSWREEDCATIPVQTSEVSQRETCL